MPSSVFSVASTTTSPLDSSPDAGGTPTTVSNFLTVQSFTNFAAMTGAISAACQALRHFGVCSDYSDWAPLAFAGMWGVISLLMSAPALRAEKQPGSILAAIFVATVNSLVLASAVSGIHEKL